MVVVVVVVVKRLVTSMPGAELDPDHLPEPLEKAISTTIKLIEDWGLIALISAVLLYVVINRLRKWRVHKQVRGKCPVRGGIGGFPHATSPHTFGSSL